MGHVVPGFGFEWHRNGRHTTCSFCSLLSQPLLWKGVGPYLIVLRDYSWFFLVGFGFGPHSAMPGVTQGSALRNYFGWYLADHMWCQRSILGWLSAEQMPNLLYPYSWLRSHHRWLSEHHWCEGLTRKGESTNLSRLCTDPIDDYPLMCDPASLLF